MVSAMALATVAKRTRRVKTGGDTAHGRCLRTRHAPFRAAVRAQSPARLFRALLTRILA